MFTAHAQIVLDGFIVKRFCTSVYLDSVESAIIFRAETLRMTVVIMFYCYFQFIPWFKNDSKVFILYVPKKCVFK